MDNLTTFRIELQVAAQKVIHQFMLHNDKIEEQLTNSLKLAMEHFDFQKEVSHIFTSEIRSAISEAMKRGKMRELVQARADKIFDELLEREFKNWESDHTKK